MSTPKLIDLDHLDYYTTKQDQKNAGRYVPKSSGMGLSTNDYTTAEKTKLGGIESGAQVNTVTGVKGNSESDYRTGNINITKANIGLGNVDNTADANKNVAYAANAGKVNNHTVNADVPAGAVFTDTTYNNATTSQAGLMSAGDKTKLNGIATGAQANTIIGVKGNAESTYRTGNVNITKANIGLGDVDNTADSEKSVAYAANAGTVNGFEVHKAVPANAIFTDTTYGVATSSANGLMSKTDKAIFDAIPNSYATQAQVDQLATTATNSVSAAVSAKNDAVTAKNQAQNIANGLASIRDTAVDTSLAISGQAADSKTVGDKFDVIGASSETNNEYMWVLLDSQNRVLLGVKADGSVAWQKGVPKPIKDELDAIKARLDALEA